MKILVFDIGGTNIRLAISAGRTIKQVIIRPVPRGYRPAIQLIAKIASRHHVSLIVGGLPGPLDPRHTKLIQSTHLPHWAGKNFARDLRERTGVKVMLENDSALAALGEAVNGAGRTFKIVAYIGFGTGIGGARIVNKKIDANAEGFEPGHHIIDWQVRTRQRPFPHPGAWESYVSGSGLLSITGRKSETITDKKIWRLAEERAAIGLVNVAVFWSPDVVVLGGSLMKKMSIAVIKRKFRRRLRVFPHPPALKQSKLGDYAGLYGALALGRRPWPRP